MAPVLIQGESGTGKELLARGIHENSPRKNKTYVVLDCSSTTASLLESELFGHVKGAFTGAAKDRAGLVETANGGSLFLDEIGEMPLDLQSKLLGVLERRTVRRVGASEERPVDIRVIAATNRDLRQEVNDGHFRADLYHRLAVVRVLVPPLRARPEDIVPIARRVLASLAERYKIKDIGTYFTDDALLKLTRVRWSGNVRELRNHLERSLAMAAGSDDPSSAVEVTMTETEAASIASGDVSDLTGTFKDAKSRHLGIFEKAYLTALLQRHKGNLSAAAREADLSRLHLRMLARRYGIAAGADKDE
jgi:transcriptional regulator with GAF, ATPase, and Fis domain